MDAFDCLRGLIAAGLTQAQIAERTKIPQPTISRIARGVVRDVPSRRGRLLQALWDLEVGAKGISQVGTQVAAEAGA